MPPPCQRQIKETQRRLMRKYNVKFLQPFDSLAQDDRPSHHATIVSHIQQLGKTELAQYHESITVDANERPWREQIRRRAQRISGLASRCREARKNETGWRMALESEVIARFSVEVACRKCRGRLWRSEQEVSPSAHFEDTHEPQLQSLKERQHNRVPCQCRSGRHRDDPMDHGINPLFEDLADEAIQYSDELRSQIPKRDERPDRVYGLRKTNRLERILDMEDKRPQANGRPIGDTLRTTPFRPDGEPVLFPFLVMEAKSEKGEDSFTDIEVQTAFAIRELLLLQYELSQAAQVDHDWEGDLLVWFLSNKGEHWRVAIGYIDLNGSQPRYLVTRLWDGSVDSTETALRLLLIIDYICDWARDIYRETVIQRLRSLVASDSRSLACDSDIFSTLDRVNEWEVDDAASQSKSSSDETPFQGEYDPFWAYDSSSGVIRDARFVRRRFIALYLTSSNFDMLLNSTRSDGSSIKMKATLYQLMKNAWRIQKSALDELEASWTGEIRDDARLVPLDKTFFLIGTLSAYISPGWQPTLELACLAISEDLIEYIGEYSRYMLMGARAWLSHLPLVNSEGLQYFFTSAIQRPAVQILFGCVKRIRLHTVVKSRGRIVKAEIWNMSIPNSPPADEESALKAGLDMPTVDRSGRLYDFISTMYRRHKIGRQEPLSSIFRLSSRIQKHDTPKDAMCTSWDNKWIRPYQLPREKNDDFLFAFSKNPPSMAAIASYAELCIFVVNPDVSFSSLIERVAQPFPARQLKVDRFEHQAGWPRVWNHKILMAQEEDFACLVKAYIDTLNGTEVHPLAIIGGDLGQNEDDDEGQDGERCERQEDSDSSAPTKRLETGRGAVKRAVIVICDSDTDDEQPGFRCPKRIKDDRVSSLSI